MRVLTVFGTRPEIIRLSRVVELLDQHCEHVLVHTGQNFEAGLSDVFFEELRVRAPDHHLGIRASSFADQAGQILLRVDELLEQARPDRVLILGDTNSGLAAIAAARRRIPVFHMEAGNRCYDDRVPEEVNRRIIDHCSTVLMPYTERSKENLVREGVERERIFVTGNPIAEVLALHDREIEASSAHQRLGVERGQYFLATLHRAENVDQPARLQELVEGLCRVADAHSQPMVVSVHPRTADKLRRFDVRVRTDRLKLIEPLGFFDFVALERHARCVLSDSGTVQEECAIFRVPNVTLRDVTERPETIECGSNILTGGSADAVARAVDVVLALPPEWTAPAEYLNTHVAATVARIVLGYRHDPRRGMG